MARRIRKGHWAILLIAAVVGASAATSAAFHTRPPVKARAVVVPPTPARHLSPAAELGIRPSSAAAHGRLGAAVPIGRPISARTVRPVPLTLPAGWSATLVPLAFGSLSRSYLLVRPAPSAGARLPVVVVLSGRGLSPTRMVRVSGFPGVTGPAILVYPAGYDFSWNAGACCGPAQAASVDDVAFLDAVIRHVLATQPDAAAGQTYVVGYSNGGRMAYRMACIDPGVFAGMAAVEAVPVASCTHLTPLRVSIVASTGDPLLTIPHGARPKVVHGYVEPTVDDVVAQWRTLDGCYGPPTVAVHGRVTVQTWAHCRGQGRVQYMSYAGGSHAWPTGRGGTPSAQQQVWQFLKEPPQPASVRGEMSGSSAR